VEKLYYYFSHGKTGNKSRAFQEKMIWCIFTLRWSVKADIALYGAILQMHPLGIKQSKEKQK